MRTLTIALAAASGLWQAPSSVATPTARAESAGRENRQFALEIAKLAVAVLGFTATTVTIGLAARQYRRAEQWKRAEFVAKEMKDFFDSPRVRNAFTMVDWGARRVNLFAVANGDEAQLPFVTRDVQVRALLPHVLRYDTGSDVQAVDDSAQSVRVDAQAGAFSPIEAQIRDSYDALLDGLERFGSYLQSGLVTPKQLAPYLSYWIEDLAAPTRDPDDCAWECALLTYIEFYGFQGVQALFRHFGKDITPQGTLFNQLCVGMSDGDLGRQLATVARRAAASRG